MWGELMKINYQLVMEQEIKENEGKTPTLLLQSCCAPCSSYVLEYLSEFFKITVLYYNPNIYPPEEFYKREEEQKKFIQNLNTKNPISFIGCEFEDDKFYEAIKGFENEKEGGQRCRKCFHLRLEKTAQIAKENNFDYFTTTLTISPHKNSAVLNDVGGELAKEYGLKYLFSDFKKKGGYKRSCELSQEFGMYRQEYCGCVYSMNERQDRMTHSKGM